MTGASISSNEPTHNVLSSCRTRTIRAKMPTAMKRGQTSLIILDSDDEEINATFKETASEPHLTTAAADPITRTHISPLPLATSKPNLKRKATGPSRSKSINDALMSKKPPELTAEKGHSTSRHSIKPVVACRPQLLEWYDGVKHQRGMPWRKDYDASLSRDSDAITQRAYDVLISEIMLQQTQM